MARKRVLTGDRPTGKLHLGHWVGSLKNRVRLQDEYDCFFIVADLHALTTEYEHPEEVKRRLIKVLNDFLDPIRETRQRFASQPEVVDDILVQGSKVARAEAQKTLGLVRQAMGLGRHQS